MVLIIASDFTFTTSHIHNWILFLLWFSLFILSGIISLFFSSSIWAPTDLGISSFSVISFCLFILFMGFSRHECYSGSPFPSPVDHILSPSYMYYVFLSSLKRLHTLSLALCLLQARSVVPSSRLSQLAIQSPRCLPLYT